MAAGLVVVPIVDGVGVTRDGYFWSDDGLISGNLQPIPVLGNASGAPAAFNTGVVDATVLRTTLATNDPAVVALQAIQNGTSTVNVGHDTSALFDGATALAPKFAKIAAASSGNNTLVNAVTGKKIRVVAYNIMGNGAVNAKFQSGSGGTDLTGFKYISGVGSGICAAFNPVGWFETDVSTALNLNLSAAVALGGEIVFLEV